MVEGVIQIKNLIRINVDANSKSIKYVKNVIFGILLNLVVTIVNIQEILVIIQ